MKVFKLIAAEFKKSLAKPGIFIVSALLALVLVFAGFSFGPAFRVGEVVNIVSPTASATNMYEIFKSDPIYKSNFDTLLSSTKEYVDTYKAENISKLLIDDAYAKFVAATTLYSDMCATGISPSEKNPYKNAVRTAISSFQSNLNDITKSGAAGHHKILITNAAYDTINIVINEMLSMLNSNAISDAAHTEILKKVKSNGDIVGKVINEIRYPTVSAKTLTDLTVEIYDRTVSRQTSILTKIDKILLDISEVDNASIAIHRQLNILFSEYYYHSAIYQQYTTSKINTEIANGISTTKIKALKHFEKYDKYLENEKLAKASFLHTTGTFDKDYANVLAFSTISNANNAANAYDFMFYALEIFSFIIILYAIYISCISISVEQSSGTIKLLAIKPITRSKIFFGKLLYCVLYCIILITFSAIISFIVGSFMFGMTSANILMIFNSSNVFVVHPSIYVLIYCLMLLIKILVFISIGMLLTTIFKNSTFTVVIGVIIYFLSLVLGLLLPGSSLLKFIPFANIALIPFFGNISLTNAYSPLAGLFASTTTFPISLLLSSIYIVVTIVGCIVIGNLIFKKRDLA